MALFNDPLTEVYAQLRLTSVGGDEIDFAGLDSLRMRLQLNAADELTLDLPAQDIDGAWRSDMPVWQQGSVIQVELGYDGELDKIQRFEVVSTTVNYPEGAGGESMTIRAVSDLARAARNTDPRTFDAGDDVAILDELCSEYDWFNGVTAALASPKKRLKKSGTSDLKFLKSIANDAAIGGPRLVQVGDLDSLIMPRPEVGDLKFARGLPASSGEWRRLHSLQMNRDGGANKTRVRVTSFDPEKNAFITLEFEADEFGGDPQVTWEGSQAAKGIQSESTTQGLLLKVVEARGYGKNECIDVLASGRFLNETDAESLARRWFLLREKLSRWATAEVDGHKDLVPYSSFELDGNIAAMDKGVWLPVTVEHNIGAGGWSASCRVVRVVEEEVVSPV